MEKPIFKYNGTELKIIYSPFLDSYFLNVHGLNYYLENNFYQELLDSEKSSLLEKIKFYDPNLSKALREEKITLENLNEAFKNY